VVCLPVTCRSRTVLRSLEILSAAEIQTDDADVKRERLNTCVNKWVPDSRQSVTIPEMVVMIEASCIPKFVISSAMSQTGSESYAIRGDQRIRVNYLNICLGRLCMNLEQRCHLPSHWTYQSAFGLQMPRRAWGESDCL
jgi:hypothetical protein